jgi:hypothetical protein
MKKDKNNKTRRTIKIHFTATWTKDPEIATIFTRLERWMPGAEQEAILEAAFRQLFADYFAGESVVLDELAKEETRRQTPPPPN